MFDCFTKPTLKIILLTNDSLIILSIFLILSYISGGYTHGQFTAKLHAYSPLLDQWEELKSMNAPRGWHCMAATSSSSASEPRLYVFGGCYLAHEHQPALLPLPSPSALPPHTAQPVSLTEYYSPRTNQWTIVRAMTNMHKEANCFSVHHYVYVFGGYNIVAKTGQKLVSRYDVASDVWLTVGQLPNGMTGVGTCVLDLPWYVIEELDDQDNGRVDDCFGFGNDLTDTEHSSSGSGHDEDEEEYLEWSTQTSLQSDDENKDNQRLNKKTTKFRHKNFKISNENSFSSSSSSKHNNNGNNRATEDEDNDNNQEFLSWLV